jgi:hypothetical protein
MSQIYHLLTSPQGTTFCGVQGLGEGGRWVGEPVFYPDSWCSDCVKIYARATGRPFPFKVLQPCASEADYCMGRKLAKEGATCQ